MSWVELLRRLGRALVALPAPLSWGLPLAWAGLIWFLSSQSIATPGGDYLLWGFLGNLTHAPLFGILALFLTAALSNARRAAPEDGEAGGVVGLPRPPFGRRMVVLVSVLVYGIVDEWHQSYTTGRHSTGSDVVTDVVGAVCVLWIVHYITAPSGADALEEGAQGATAIRGATETGATASGATGSGATERGLRLRLLAGIALCMAVAWLGMR